MMDKIAPVSVIIPCYRCSSTIERAVVSVANQTLKPAEVILVNDASGDGTSAVLFRLSQQYPGWVKILELKENLGAASARNAGWEASNQRYIAFLDSDDAWHPRKVEIQYAYMEAHPEVVLCGHNKRVISQNDGLPDWTICGWDEEFINKSSLLLSNRFITPSAMLRREIPQRYASGQRYMEDHLLWLEIVCSGGLVTKLTVELAAIYKNPFGMHGLSGQLWAMEKGDLGNFVRLYRNGCINMPLWLSLSLYSFVKFARRLVMYWGYLRWKK